MSASSCRLLCPKLRRYLQTPVAVARGTAEGSQPHSGVCIEGAGGKTKRELGPTRGPNIPSGPSSLDCRLPGSASAGTLPSSHLPCPWTAGAVPRPPPVPHDASGWARCPSAGTRLTVQDRVPASLERLSAAHSPHPARVLPRSGGGPGPSHSRTPGWGGGGRRDREVALQGQWSSPCSERASHSLMRQLHGPWAPPGHLAKSGQPGGSP